MLVGDLCTLLTRVAKQHAPDALGSLYRNTHMHTYRGLVPTQALVDAVIVDFVNAVARDQGADLALYTRDLYT